MQRGSVEQRKSMGMAKRYGPVMTALRQGGDGGGRLTLQPGGMGGGGTRGFTPRKGGFASGGGGGARGFTPGTGGFASGGSGEADEFRPTWSDLLRATEGGAELPRHIAQEAEEQARVERAVEAARERAEERARVDTVSGAAPAVKREDAWKWRSAAERAEYEETALGAPDFAGMRAAGERVGRPSEDPFLRMLGELGFGTGAYGDREDRGRRAVKTLNDPGYRRLHSDGNSEYAMENLDYLEPEQRAVIMYYAGRGEYEKIGAYLETLDRDLNERQRARESVEQPKWAEEQPFQAVGANIAGSFTSPSAYLETMKQAWRNFLSGEEVPVDPNSQAFSGVHLQHDTEQGVRSAARKAAEEATGSTFWGDAAAGAAGLGLGMGRLGSKLFLGPGFAALYQGTGAAGEAATGAAERGGSAGQAAAMGTAVGTIEAVSQLLPLENLFSLGKTAPKTVRELVTGAAAQAGLSAGQAALSQVGTELADTFILGDKGEFESMVRSLEAQGLESGEARARALMEDWLRRPGQAAAAGAAAGGLSALAARGLAALREGAGAPADESLDDGARKALEDGWGDTEPSVRGPEDDGTNVPKSVEIPGEHDIIGTGERGGEILQAKARHESSETDPVYKEVNIHGPRNSELDDVDLIDQIIYEDKDASSLYMENPNFPQTEQQWAYKQIFNRTKNRILALQQEQFRMSSEVSPTLPSTEGLRGIRTYVFRVSADTPALREAVQAEMDQLSELFPDYEFYAVFGGN